MEFSTFVVVFYFLVVVINQFSFLAVLLVGLIVQLIYYLQLQWFVTKLTVTYMFKRVIFSRFTQSISLLYYMPLMLVIYRKMHGIMHWICTGCRMNM